MSAAARRPNRWLPSVVASLVLFLVSPSTSGANDGSCGIQHPPQSRSQQGECTGGSSCPNKMCELTDWNATKNKFEACDCVPQNNSGCGWIDPLYAGDAQVGVVAPVGSSLEVRVRSSPGGLVIETIGAAVSPEGPTYIPLTRPVVAGEYISVANLTNLVETEIIPVQNVVLGAPGLSPYSLGALIAGLLGLSVVLLSRRRRLLA